MTTDLLPCPFCGEPAYDDMPTWRVFGKRVNHEYAIACSSCEAVAPADDDPALAKTAWNSRADLSPSPEVVKELVEAARAMLDRHVLYCGGPGLPYAGHTDEKLFARLSAVLAKLEGGE